MERGREPLKGYWSLPGGVLECGETLKDGIRREVLEETGLIVEPATIVEVFERIMRDTEGRPEYHYVLIDYLCAVNGGTLTAGDDVARAEWFVWPDVQNLLLTEGTAPVIDKAFAIMRRISTEPVKIG